MVVITVAVEAELYRYTFKQLLEELSSELQLISSTGKNLSGLSIDSMMNRCAR